MLKGHLAAAQAGPESDGSGGATIIQLDGLLHGDGARDRGRRAREHRHQPVSEVLDLGARARRQRLAQQGEVLEADLIGFLGCQTSRQRGGPDDIREEDGYRLRVPH